MVTLTFNGKPFDPEDFTDAVMQAAVDQIKEHLRELIAPVRNPATGEFPVVLITGSTLETIAARVEGSADLLALVQERLDPDDMSRTTFVEVERSAPPRAFLSFAWEDHALAERIAQSLQANGIETWWADWEIKAGDSLRQKIDEGLSKCTVFLVLLTPEAIKKSWVNQEMDAGLMCKVEAQARFIALRSNLSHSELPPLLKGTLSPALEDFDRDIRQLINDIHGISRKPLLGPLPAVVRAQENSGYSAAATVIAGIFIARTKNGRQGDPLLTVHQLCDKASLSEEDVEDALYELGDMVEGGHGSVLPKSQLFVTFDKYFTAWDPAADGLTVAVDLINDPCFPREPQSIAERYGWEPHRLNSALGYLDGRNLIHSITCWGMEPWSAAHIEKNDETRRFVKSRL
jgi:hypothetical protein